MYVIANICFRSFGVGTQKRVCSHKKEEILPFMTTCMDPESIMLSEIHQKEKDKNHMILLTCGT